jgi:hypothetical protein
MERAPKQEQDFIDADFEVVEVDGWRQLVEVAPLQAEELISDIDGFAEMSAGGQIAELQMLLERLATNNEKRFVAEEIAKRLTATKATKIYSDTMNRVGVAPNGSNRSIAV